jgi:hypothetical protein
VHGRERILEHAHMSKRFGNLIGAADSESAAVPRLHCRDVAIGKQDAACARWQDPGNHIEERGLTGAVRSQNTNDAPRLDLEVEPVYYNEAAEGAEGSEVQASRPLTRWQVCNQA